MSFIPYCLWELSHSVFYSFIIYPPPPIWEPYMMRLTVVMFLGSWRKDLKLVKLDPLQEIFFLKSLMDDTNVHISLENKSISYININYFINAFPISPFPWVCLSFPTVKLPCMCLAEMLASVRSWWYLTKMRKLKAFKAQCLLAQYM